MYYIIKNIKDLNSLPPKRNIKFRRISIQHPQIDKNTLNELEEKLNKNYFACGCKTGSSFIFIGASLCIIHFAVYAKQFLSNNLFYYIAIIIVSAFAGKLLGLLSAKIKLLKIRKKIVELYSNSLYQENI